MESTVILIITHTHPQAAIAGALAFINASHSGFWVAAVNSDAKVSKEKQRKLLKLW